MQMKRGFTLLEIAVVLVIVGLMSTLMLQTQKSATTQDASCGGRTQTQLVAIRAALDHFVQANSRYPAPTARNLGINNPEYGKEDISFDTTDILTNSKPIVFGSLPFATLGLPTSFGADCWGNQFSYFVTKNLTTTEGFQTKTSTGGLTIKSGTLATPNTTDMASAYAVISHGLNGDERGGVKPNYTGASHRWCATGAAIDSENCDITNAVVFNSTLNNGANAGVNYFDDLVISGSKMKLGMKPSNVFCWGQNDNGQLGDGTQVSRATKLAAALPEGVRYFYAMAQGYYSYCAIADTGQIYCWPTGTPDYARVPTLVSTPAGAIFTQINGNGGTFVALDSTGKIYQGGASGFALVTQPSVPVGVTFKRVVSSFGGIMHAIGSDGKVYGWSTASLPVGGSYTNGIWGDPSSTRTARTTPQEIANMPIGAKFEEVAAGYNAKSCAIRDNGESWCWGTDFSSDTAPTQLAGGPYWKVTQGGQVNHFIGVDGYDYVVGSDSTYGTTGDGLAQGSSPGYTTPHRIVGSDKFANISAAVWGNVCGLNDEGSVFCWGANHKGQLGDDTIGGMYNSTPQQVLSLWPVGYKPAPNTMSMVKVVSDVFSTCAIAPSSEDSAQCVAQSFSWKDASTGKPGCHVTVPALPSGTYATVTDNINTASEPETGNAYVLCNNGALELLAPPSCN